MAIRDSGLTVSLVQSKGARKQPRRKCDTLYLEHIDWSYVNTFVFDRMENIIYADRAVDVVFTHGIRYHTQQGTTRKRD